MAETPRCTARSTRAQCELRHGHDAPHEHHGSIAGGRTYFTDAAAPSVGEPEPPALSIIASAANRICCALYNAESVEDADFHLVWDWAQAAQSSQNEQDAAEALFETDVRHTYGPDAIEEPPRSLEGQARDLLCRAGVPEAETYSAGDVIEMANMLRDLSALRSSLEEARKDSTDARRYRALRDMLESSVSASVEVNDQRGYYETNPPGEEVRLQFYPDTPIGFYVVNGSTMDEATDALIDGEYRKDDKPLRFPSPPRAPSPRDEP